MKRRKVIIEVPEHIRTQALNAADMLGVTIEFGNEEHLKNMRYYDRLIEQYKEQKCAGCYRITTALAFKGYRWLCKSCYFPPKTYSSNEE